MLNKSFIYKMLLPAVLLLLSGCYYHLPKTSEGSPEYTERQLDSLSFSASHHYSNNYNFVVKADSLILIKQQPEELINNMPVDTVVIKHNNHLVVADIRILPTDPVDSVWVQLARDQSTFGWIHESKLLPAVVPDDPISQFISTFSDTHLIIFLIVICLMGTTYLVRKMFRNNARLVHVRDINSFYPTLLTLLVAGSATFYASIQMFAPDTWRHFYFHPTLNPFSVPLLLSVFLISVWAILIVGLAVVDDVRHKLPFSEAMWYLFSLMAICAVNYIAFSISTLYYIGYFLLAAYIFFAVKRYWNNSRYNYTCGHCGERLRTKGRCPHCGAINN